MQIFTENDLPAKKPQLMQVIHSGTAYDMIPLHVSIDAIHLRRAGGRASEHRHDIYHVILYGESRGDFSINGRILPAEQGVLVLSSPGEGHFFPPVLKGMMKYSEFTFSYVSAKGKHLGIPFKELLSMHSGIDLLHRDNVMKLNSDQYGELNRVLAGISEIKESSSGIRHIQFYRNIAELFNFLTLSYAAVDLPVEDSPSAGLSRARDYIHANYGKKIRIAKIAEIACLSKGHFQRAFKKKFGISPVGYINEHRISAARTLLCTTPYPCAEIAERAGFEDIFYFSKVFKKISGTSPAAYRNGNGSI
ncbi:MAG: AraC family transcriptional regulator [Victivallales bacterium]